MESGYGFCRRHKADGGEIINYQKAGKKVNVAYHCTDNYAQITATSILSIFENNKDMDEIDVYMIENGFTDATKDKMGKLAERYGRRIFFIAMPDFVKEYGLGLVRIKEKWGFDSYSRLFLDRLLPDCNKVLYLDGDTIVNGSLKKLWETDLEGKSCAAALDCISEAYYKLFGLGENARYCNSGVILMDLDKWRERHIGDKVREYVNENKGYVFFMEQTVFNAVLQDQIQYLDAECNVSTLMQTMSYEELKRLRRFKYFYSREEVENAVKSPLILHMTGFFYVTNRAWNKVTDHPARYLFAEYCGRLGGGTDALQEDGRDCRTKAKDFLLRMIPKPIVIMSVSWIYNVPRVKFIRWQSLKAGN